jgi:hypothetical protein
MAPQVESFKPQQAGDDTGSSHAASTAMLEETNQSLRTDIPNTVRPQSEPQVLDFGTHNIYGNDMPPLAPVDGNGEPPSPQDKDKPPTHPTPPTELPDGWKQRQEGDQPIILQTPNGENVTLPKDAKNIQIHDGKASYEQNGVTVDVDQHGKPVAYHSQGFSFEYHADVDKWYYHQDSGGDYVQIDVPNVSADGSVHTREHGGFNSGRTHDLTASGQTTESQLTTIQDKLRAVGFNPDAPFVEGFYPFLGDVNGRKPTIVNAVDNNESGPGSGAGDVTALEDAAKKALGANLIDHPKDLKDMVDQLLQSGQPLGNIVIDAHGAPGGFGIGGHYYDLNDPAVIEQFARLKEHMENGARIVIQACQTGHGPDAVNQLQALADASGADVQAFSWYQTSGLPGYGPNIVAHPRATNS